MTVTRIHRAVSADGTEIAGRVQGDGPALVLVHGGIGDGEVAWDAVLPYLTDRFRCYLPSTRGRGLSEDNPDHSPPRLEEDVMAFVDSIGEPVYVVGWSGSWAWVLCAAVRCPAVSAVAVYEPVVLPVAGPDDLAATGATMEQVGLAASSGRLVNAVRAFAPWIGTDEEIAALERTDFYERWSTRVPAMLRFIQGDASYDGPRSTDPDALARIQAPVLILQGQRTRLHTWLADGAQYINDHVASSQFYELPGLGHFAPLLEPASIADELVTFFESARQTA